MTREQTLAGRARWNDPLYVAQQLRVMLEYPTLPGAGLRIITRQEAATEFQRLYPRAARRLGAAVIAAATPKTSACRWCAAALYSRVHGVPAPNPRNLGARALLGMPCSHPRRLTAAGRRAAMRQLAQRIEPSRLDARQRQFIEVTKRTRALVAADQADFNSGDPASWRRWARKDLKRRAPWVLDRRR
jgi:hypothetical protein